MFAKFQSLLDKTTAIHFYSTQKQPKNEKK